MQEDTLAERVLKAHDDKVDGPQLQVVRGGIIYTFFGSFRAMPDPSHKIVELLGQNATQQDPTQRNPEAEAELREAVEKAIAGGREFVSSRRIKWPESIIAWSLDPKGAIMRIPYFQILELQQFDEGHVVRQNFEGHYHLRPGVRLEWEAGQNLSGIAEVVEFDCHSAGSTFFTMRKLP